MATSAQLKALLQSYAEGDESRFYGYAMQIAAHEAHIGHGEFAKELREIIDTAKKRRDQLLASDKMMPIAQPKGELSRLLTVFYPENRLSDMILHNDISSRLIRIIKEQRHIEQLKLHSLSPRRKLLLIGPPGTGKTMTASVLAGELHLPLFVIRLEGVITKFMGETSAKLRLVFDAISQHRGVYLFDEFDSIGTMRAAINDVGEIRRILNSYFQFIDQDNSDSLILAATNYPNFLDYALFRRFDDVIEYHLPSDDDRTQLMKNLLAGKKTDKIIWENIIEESKGLSYAEITRAIEDAMKNTIINNQEIISQSIISSMLEERQSYHQKHINHTIEFDK